MKKNIELERAIVDYGGQLAVAKALGVTQGAVSQWTLGRTRITAERALELIGLFNNPNLHPSALCPDAKWDALQKIPRKK